MNKPENQPAFQVVTLRDYFAAKAMQAMLSNSFLVEEMLKILPNKTDAAVGSISKQSYVYANAMMAARATPNEKEV